MTTDNTATDNSYYQRLALNILNDGDAAQECVTKALSSARSTSTWMDVIRLTRNFAFEKYMHISEDTSDNPFTSILTEFSECVRPFFADESIEDDNINEDSDINENNDIIKDNINDEENVIPLQVYTIADSFVRTLSAENCSVFIRRYFYAESIENIASRYGISEKRTATLLSACRKALRELISSKNYIMKPATLFDGITGIGDELLIGSEEYNRGSEKRWIIPVSIVASLLAVIGISVSLIVTGLDSDEAATSSISASYINQIYENIYYDPDDIIIGVPEAGYMSNGQVDIDKLLSIYTHESDDGYGVMINVSPYYATQYTILYEECGTVDNEILEDCIGYQNGTLSRDDDSTIYYYLKGHDTMEYMITREDEDLHLWHFYDIYVDTDASSTFSFVLSWRYGIGSADAIDGISITKLQKVDDIYLDTDFSIQTEELTLSSSFSYIYYILSELEYNVVPWEELTDTEYTFEEIQETAVKLNIASINGNVTDDIYYSPVDGRFYLEEGYAFEKLNENAKQTINEIVGVYTSTIDEEESGEGATQEETIIETDSY